MPSGKVVKLILYEGLQFTALVVPVLVIMERFASLIRDMKGQDLTAYWLVVAVSIAYMTSVTLLVWVPLKYVIMKGRRFITNISQWRPTALAYLILCTFPCFAILIVSSKVQVDGGHRLDHFTELPVSLVLFSLICVDVIERIRPCRLMGQSDDLDVDITAPGPILTHLEPVTTVSGQLHPHEGQNGLTHGQPETRNGSATGRWQDPTGSPGRSTLSTRTPAYLYSSSSRPRSHSGHLGFLWRKDGRSEVFVDSFMFWLDTVEMVRVGGEPSVFYSAWVFPVYILAFMSTLRMAVTPQNSLLSFAGVALQDFPFFIIRVALIAVFGYVTPVLYPLKNVLVTLTYIYFTFLTKLKIFRSHSMF
ncbi:transmembrane protein 236 [Sphaeramia orbicularis]|uniref:transmembrane protein 236 n=1 Tax=Sphaeramia orbicularis TaxID=375764 RepID=UPI00117C98CC|nr:transmembrane protein 236-like [Sphaeramia orbicularis]